MDKKMNDPWPYVFGFVAIISLIVTIVLIMQSNIDKKIDDKLNDPKFIKKLANEARLPFLIFDEKNKILADYGAYQYLEKISILNNEKNELIEIRISPKHFMNIAPIIECINGRLVFREPERIDEIDWLIKIIPTTSYFVAESHEGSVNKFKLTIFK